MGTHRTFKSTVDNDEFQIQDSGSMERRLAPGWRTHLDCSTAEGQSRDCEHVRQSNS